MNECKVCANADNEYCFACDNGNQFKPMTNADRIRSMTDEELATWIAERKETCPPIKFYGCSFKTCGECWLDWLKEEAEEAEP